METNAKWVSYTCTCGFKLDHVPRDVVEDLPRCLGCGRSLRAPAQVRVNRLTRVREWR
jgi:hypothetical protein